MPIKLITGAPGNGKTLYAIDLIEQALKTGRSVYSNINGINIDGVEPIPTNSKGELDWTLTPQGDEITGTFGAFVVYDETQKLNYFAYKPKEKLSTNPLITGLEDHRHLGYDFIFITQSPKFLHLHLLEIVNDHFHVKRPFNKAQAEIHLHKKTCFNPESAAAEQRAEDIFKFTYKKEDFAKYKSTEIVTNKGIRIPRYMYKLGAIAAFCFFAIIYIAFFSGNKYFSAKQYSTNASDHMPADLQDQQQKDANNKVQGLDERTYDQRRSDFEAELKRVSYNVNKPYEFDQSQYIYEIKTSPVLAGCAIIDNKCSCYSQQATKLDISTADCKRYMNGDKPFNPFHDSQQQFQQQQYQVQYQQNFRPTEQNQLSREDMAKFEEAKRLGLI